MPYPCGSSRHQLRRSPHRLHLSAREIVSSGVRMSRLMLLGERAHVDHRPVLALIAGQPQPLAQPLDHREVGLPPGVDLGLGMPSHHPRMDWVARPGKPL